VKSEQHFEVDDMVRIQSGAFTAFTGRVKEIDDSRMVLKVLVSIFGRFEPIELAFADVEKLIFREEE
jgi:transcription antitermination factor NusG